MIEDTIKKTAIDYKFETLGYVKKIEVNKDMNGVAVLSALYLKAVPLEVDKYDFVPKDGRTYVGAYTLEIFADCQHFWFSPYGAMVCKEDENFATMLNLNISEDLLAFIIAKGKELIAEMIKTEAKKNKYEVEDGNVVKFPVKGEN